MKLFTYVTNDTDNTINKKLENEKEFDITFKQSQSILNPVIKLQTDEALETNYAYIPKFERYYFVRDNTRLNNDVVELTLEVDVLESYKEDILASQGNVTRYRGANKYYDGSGYATDAGSGYLTEVRKEHKEYYSDTTPEFEETVLMTMIGGVRD